MNSLDDRKVVVTGGATGIGRAVTAEFVRRGDTVVVVGRRREPLEAIASELRNVVPVVADVTDPTCLRVLAEFVGTELGTLDILVANAGGAHHGPTESLEEIALHWHRSLDQNLLSAVLTEPDGPELFPQMRPACVEPTPHKRNRAMEKAARMRLIRNKLQTQRPINAQQRRLDRVRRREVDLRKWRNNSRKLLFILKGGRASTSPFSRWINDPLEPEELVPGWRPPPGPVSQDFDDPPF